MSFPKSFQSLLVCLLLAAPLLAPAQHRPGHAPQKAATHRAAPAAPKTRTTRPKTARAKATTAARQAAARKAALTPKKAAPAPAFTQYLHSPWVDSLMRVLTPNQRAAQLFMVAAYSNRTRVDEDSISALIKQYGIGGLIFFQGGPARQARLLNRYQSQSQVPLLVALDGEWGVGMRLDSVVKFPYQMSLGGETDTTLLYDMGHEVAQQFKRLGMHVNFAPVVDVNNNAANPVIGFRSWGENPAAVSRDSRQYMRGMQDAGILAVAKHFPGHGDVDADSHLALPTVRVDRRRLDTLELPPFRSLIAGGLGGMMVAHLNVPALDTVSGPSTLSRPIITDFLRKEMGFKGLIFTDAMNMKGVISKFPPGEADVRALIAGNDILEFSKNVPLAIQMVRAAVDSGRISQKEIDEHCRRVLALKQWAGLDHYRPIETKHIYEDLNGPHARYLSHRLTELSITLLRNQNKLLPLQRLDTLRIATLVLGGSARDTTDFQKAVADYAPTAHFHASASPTLDELLQLRTALKPYNMVLVSLQSLGRLPATSFGITPETNLLLRELVNQKQEVVVSVFGSAYAVAKVRDLDRAGAVVLAYQESPDAQNLAAQAIFGGMAAAGKLPVTVSDRYPRGYGLRTAGNLRLRYANPEDVDMDGHLEAQVDSLVGRAMAAQAFPGAQVVIARRGTVVLRKSYGNHTYAGLGNVVIQKKKKRKQQAASSPESLSVPRPVRNDDIYDLASVTKLMASTPALLKLQEQNKFSPDSTMGQYFPFLRGTNKANLRMRDVLTHQARLKAWIPFWKELTRKNGELRRRFFRSDSSARFPLPAAQGLWARKKLPARIYKEIGESPLNEKPGYVYSDLSFILYPELVKARTGQTFDAFLQREVYGPLGATTLGFRPTNRFPLRRIVPTEVDSAFRRQLLHGTVHDEGAALLGGLSGHAGLFGSANDLAKLAQTYAWGGRYGGQQIFKQEILADWTRCQFCPDNRRALAFDRPATNPTVNSAKNASQSSYGHTGYTGTYFWVEPKEDLVVILLTNRVHPSRNNNKLTELGVRSALLQIAIEAVHKQ
ncbi:glycoside hydrolase family 3 N-terminal domain-containing protein [Hymenobacter sp. BT770]|uniref:glycoside hydrolase family 3 N-terminal domain-containing protein n=1 Tax=Hymenobacter sp. BT770 TaxID=2886942 RepID=UPI001D11D6F6|nr:glycoside hydrolase family 3 N-terminal domain-containing protein [Hymenobacter sp. BT770]MCC3154258.1 serine hydrolase [Hymenobacter sp. BT770]MDO3416362.1 glycoside hydrolase family 3 N-terminal domain-containing protein [Hymenobacter sp. BT770]